MKNVLITGTSSGVGRESAILFAQNGYHVFATMRNTDKSTELRSAIDKENLSIDILQLDVTDEVSIKQAVDVAIEKSGKIDILLNNAGAGFAKPIEQATVDQIDWVTNVNYRGVVLTTRAVLPFMRKEKSGHIINISSVGGLIGQPFNELYCAAKFAVEGLTESLASYLTPAFNVAFSLIEPGGIATEFMTSAVNKTTGSDGQLVTGDFAPIFEKYVAGTQRRSSEDAAVSYQTGREVAEIILKVAEMEQPPLRIRTSQWAEELSKFKTETDPDGTQSVNFIIEQFM